jgi:hypothetical protein
VSPAEADGREGRVASRSRPDVNPQGYKNEGRVDEQDHLDKPVSANAARVEQP